MCIQTSHILLANAVPTHIYCISDSFYSSKSAKKSYVENPHHDHPRAPCWTDSITFSTTFIFGYQPPRMTLWTTELVWHSYLHDSVRKLYRKLSWTTTKTGGMTSCDFDRWSDIDDEHEKFPLDDEQFLLLIPCFLVKSACVYPQNWPQTVNS